MEFRVGPLSQEMSGDDEDLWRQRRRRFSPFADIDELFHEFEKWLEEGFRTLEPRIPDKLVRERRLPDGSIVRESGPIVYGYSVTIGPEGKPVIRTFGNVGPRGRGLAVREEREPLVDVLDTDGEVKVVAELPGADKEQIQVKVSEDLLTIRVDDRERPYYKEVELPSKVDAKGARSTYKNGVLEVSLPKQNGGKKQGFTVSVE